MGTIKLDKDEMLKEAKELSVLKEEINYILNKLLETENVLRREKSVSTYSQERKLSDIQDLAFNLVREFDKISDNFYQAAKAYESTEDKLNNLVNINKDNNIRNIIAVNSMNNTYFNSDNTTSEEKEETTFDKLKELVQEGWQLIKDYYELKIAVMDFVKDICDNINTCIDGYIESHEEFFEEFNEEHPILSVICFPLQQLVAVRDVTLNFLKEMTFELVSNIFGMLSYEYHGLVENPDETVKENIQSILIIKAILSPTSKGEVEIRDRVLLGIWEDIKADFNSEVINGNPYTASRYVYNLAIEIGSLFFGAGELKAAAGIKKADNVIDGVRVIDKVSDAGKAGKSIAIAAKIEKKIGKSLTDVIHTKIDSLFEFVKQTKDVGSEISVELRNKIFGVKEVKIPKSNLTQAEINAILSGCFTGDTLVLTEDGLKEIKYVNEGDFVYSRNEESGQVSLKKVIYTYIKEAKDFIKLKLGSSEIECTPNHLFMLDNGVWMTAERLGVGYRIVNSDGSVSVVEGIEYISYNEGKAIYNLNVEDNHTYFVSQEKVCVHNDCMVTAEGIERVLNAIPKGTPKDISWNDFQTLMKGQGNTAEKAAAYSKFSKKDIKSINKLKTSVLDKSIYNGEKIYTAVEYEGITKVDGEIRNISRRVYKRNDIDWNQVDSESGLTNLQLAKQGRSPKASDGSVIELHHLIQLEPGAMVEIPSTLHDEYSRILHGLVENGGSFRNNPTLKKQYSNFKSKYWRWRAKNL